MVKNDIKEDLIEMVKIIIQQENEDGTKTIVFKDPNRKGMFAVITGKTPDVIDKQLVIKEKLNETMNKIRKEVSERIKIFVLLSEEGEFQTKGQICRRIEPLKYDMSEIYTLVGKHLLILEKIGLIEHKKIGRLTVFNAKTLRENNEYAL